jgi:hypothetical protein
MEAPSVCRKIGWLTVFENATSKNSHDWTTTDAHEAPAIEALLRAPVVRRLWFYGAMPEAVDPALLQSVFARSHCVELSDSFSCSVLVALCRALEQDDCKITILSPINPTFPGETEMVASAMATNKSVKRVVWSGGRPDRFFDCCDKNTSIEEVYIYSEGKCRGWIVDKIFAMPSVSHIIPYMNDPPSLETIKNAWPQSIITHESGAPRHIFKTPGTISYGLRQKLRALYECAGRVLPDHVIRDIADEVRLCDLRREALDGWLD